MSQSATQPPPPPPRPYECRCWKCSAEQLVIPGEPWLCASCGAGNGAPPVVDDRPPLTKAVAWARTTRGQRSIIAGVLAVIVIVVVLVVVVPGAQRFTLTGTVQVSGGSSDLPTVAVVGDTCHGENGFDDMKIGTTVTVTNSDGKVVAVGAVDGATPSGVDCVMSFTVPDVPSSDFYGVEVAHRGSVQFSRDQAKSGVVLTLGS